MKRPQRLRRSKLSYQSLEQRKMLAGDVTAQIIGDQLLITGDNLANQIEINQNADGTLAVTGLDTTINGSTGGFNARLNLDSINVVLGAANDQLTLGDFIFKGGSVSYFGGEGNDRLITNKPFAEFFHIDVGAGNDVLEVDMIATRSVDLQLGDGDDVVSATSLFAGRNFTLSGGNGDDTFVSEDLSVSKNLMVETHDGDDSLVFSGRTRVRSTARTYTGEGNDFVGFVPEQNSSTAEFRRYVAIDTGNGDDELVFDASTTLMNGSRIDGRGGSDSIASSTTNFESDSTLRRFESTTVADLTDKIDAVFETLESVGVGDGGVDETETEFSVTSNTLTVTENATSVAADSLLSLTGSRNATVTEATVTIADFASSQESLSFENTNLISGAFNSTTGVLTLTGDASVSQYQAAMRSVRYQNTSDNPDTSTRQIEFSVDVDGETFTGSRDFAVVAVDDTPTIELSTSNRTVDAADLPATIDSLIDIADVDTNRIASVTVSIEEGFVSGEDQLEFTATTGITGEYNESTGVLNFTGNVDTSVFETVLRSLRFNSTATDPAGDRIIRFVIDDGNSTASTQFDLKIDSESTENNVFDVSENAANRTVIGTAIPETNFSGPVVFQFAEDSTVNERLLLNADDHISGDLDSPLVLIEYLDFQCPACAAIHPEVSALEQQFDGDLIIVRRHLPLEAIHGNARAAAIVSEAAANQGQFEGMSDLLFEHQDDWADLADPTTIFEGFAADLNLDLDRFRTDVADPALDARVTRDANDASNLGFGSTPTLVLDNTPLASIPTPGTFDDVVQDALDNVDDIFTINRDNGEIRVLDSSQLNASTTPRISLPVVVTDVDGNTETINVEVNVF